MKAKSTKQFKKLQLIQNNPSDASRHLPLHKGGIDSESCEATKNGFIDESGLPFSRQSFLCFEAVARAPDGFDILRIGAVRLDFVADPVDMDGDGRGLAYRVKSPYLIKNHILAVDHIRIRCEECEQIELLVRERDLFLVDKHAAGVGIYRELADIYNIIDRLFAF